MANDPNAESWSLEVVRGADAGHRFALAGGIVVLGNALDGAPGIDLSAMEATSPRKMAGRQAQIHVLNGSILLRDLGSPGGTFVDRRRVPANSDLPLNVGDVIQLGGVQLRVARGAAEALQSRVEPQTTASSFASSSGFLFTLKTGATCRTFNDFLAVSAQRWGDLRDELTSGRLAGFLATIGRTDLAPDPKAAGSPDERLDAWLVRLPATTPARPELEAHPASVVVRAPGGGGVVRKKVQVSNAGYGLLKVRARVEPPAATWLAIAMEFNGREVAIVESTDLTFDATIPDGLTSPLSAEVVIEGNGGTSKIAVRVEPPGAKVDEPSASAIPRPRFGIKGRVAKFSATARLVALPLVAAGLRLAVALADAIRPGSVGSASPGLLGPLLAFAALGAVVAVIFSFRGGEVRDLPTAGLSGAILGAMAAALAVAACRAIEAPIITLLGPSVIFAILAWAAVGGIIAGLSLVVVPPQSRAEHTS